MTCKSVTFLWACFFRPYRTVFEKSVIVCHLLPKGPVHQAPRMDRLMRYLPLPTGGKPFKWSTFLEKNLSSLSTGHEGPLWSKVLRKNSSQYPLEGFAGFERKILKISLFSTHWTETGEVVRFFENFFLPLPTGGKWAVWSKGSETFFSQYSTDTWSRFERKKMKKASGNYPKAVEIFIFS